MKPGTVTVAGKPSIDVPAGTLIFGNDMMTIVEVNVLKSGGKK